MNPVNYTTSSSDIGTVLQRIYNTRQKCHKSLLTL